MNLIILGSYCIYKKNRCPFGMFDGSIKWDDEDDKNYNYQSGILPDGTYDSNSYGSTTIKYCCQEHGYWFNSIELPVDRPFYLLPHKSPHCQRVKWALSSLEYIVYDTENYYNRDTFTASYVFSNENESLPKIFYCYYQGMYINLFEADLLHQITYMSYITIIRHTLTSLTVGADRCFLHVANVRYSE